MWTCYSVIQNSKNVHACDFFFQWNMHDMHRTIANMESRMYVFVNDSYFSTWTISIAICVHGGQIHERVTSTNSKQCRYFAVV